MSGQPIRRPVRRAPPPPSAGLEKRTFSGCVVPIIIALLVMGGIAYFFYRQLGFQGILDKLYPNHPDVEIIDPFKDLTNRPPKEVEKPEVKGERDDGEDEEKKPETPKKKTVAELQAEAAKAEKQLIADVAKARAASSKSLPAFAGVKFGEKMNGPYSSLEDLPPDVFGEVKGEALCQVTEGPKLSSSFRQFGTRPRVFVTPVTHRAFRIELSRSIERRVGWPLNPETTNLVAKLSSKLKAKPLSVDVSKIPLGRHEFVFPFGETTLVVGEYGGEQLKLTVENARIRAAAVEETPKFRQQAADEAVPSKTLSSDKYPNSGVVKTGRVRQKKGTIKSFGGIVFGSLPPYSARVSAPPSKTDAKSFFIDYRKAKMDPFMNFDHGRAELSAINGAVIGVKLHSNGPTDGLSEADYARRVRAAIEKRFPSAAPSAAADPLAPATYELGSVKIVFAPDPNGGFSLSAVNEVMKETW